MKKTLLFAFSLLFAFNAHAIEYSSVVSMDVTDTNASAAKQRAWTHANRVALNNVMAKISNEVSIDYLTDEQILNLVKETAVLSEKNSDIRYIGKLKIVFNNEVLDEFLEEKNIQKINVYTSKVLVIPMHQSRFYPMPMLWEAGNKLKQAFEKNSINNSVVEIKTIEPNADNYSLINLNDLLALDKYSLQQIAAANNVQDVFVIKAQEVGADEMALEINHYKANNITSESISVIAPENEDQSMKQDIFDVAAHQAAEFINFSIKENSLKVNNTDQKLNVIFNFNSLHQLTWLQDTLKKVEYIKHTSPVAMQKGRVELELQYVGEYSQLLYILHSKSLTIKKDGNYHIIERI